MGAVHIDPTEGASCALAALITGGSAGLGRALAAGLADDGWDVVITGRDRERLDAAAAELGPRVTAVAGDVTDPGHRDHLAEVVADGLDLLVNNASTLAGRRAPARWSRSRS